MFVYFQISETFDWVETSLYYLQLMCMQVLLKFAWHGNPAILNGYTK